MIEIKKIKRIKRPKGHNEWFNYYEITFSDNEVKLFCVGNTKCVDTTKHNRFWFNLYHSYYGCTGDRPIKKFKCSNIFSALQIAQEAYNEYKNKENRDK